MKTLEQHDYVRALRMASYGFLLYGPFSHLWYQFLERHLPGATAKNLSLKVCNARLQGHTAVQKQQTALISHLLSVTQWPAVHPRCT